MSPETQIRSGDLIRDEYEVSFNGRQFIVRKGGTRIDFFCPGAEQPSGSIRFGSHWSGAVWLGGNLIGEYEHRDDVWYVMPIIGGRKDPDTVLQVHPATYLLDSIVQAREMAFR